MFGSVYYCKLLWLYLLTKAVNDLKEWTPLQKEDILLCDDTYKTINYPKEIYHCNNTYLKLTK